jgi:hypothetical protein
MDSRFRGNDELKSESDELDSGFRRNDELVQTVLREGLKKSIAARH